MKEIRINVCSTPFGIKDCCTVISVNFSDDENLCSTPFGIKDCCTTHAATYRTTGHRVLNAFRHQRLLHAR